MSERAKHSQTVSQWNTHIFEVQVGQLRKHVDFDTVLPKYDFVLIQAEAAQPSPDIHLCLSPHQPGTTNDGPEERSCPEPSFGRYSALAANSRAIYGADGLATPTKL